MTASFVDPVEPSGVSAVQPVHSDREIGLRGLDYEVIVIGHQDPHRDRPAKPFSCLPEEGEEGLAIAIGAEDVASFIAARGDVVESVFEFDSYRSCHNATEDPSGHRDHRGISAE